MPYLFTLARHFLTRQLRSIPVPETSYAGRTVIVTGGNGGLGLEAARHFARLGAARLILACRRTDAGEAAMADIVRTTGVAEGVVEVWSLDLSSFESVKAFCKRAETELERLDVLLMNAAVMGGLQTKAAKMAEGYEMMVTVNVLATFLMVLGLLPVMRRTVAKENVEGVVTVVASEAHFMTRFVEQHQPRIFEAFRPGGAMQERYGTTKLLDVLAVQELAERLDATNAGHSPIVVNTANPGMCRSSLFRDLPWFAQWLLAPVMYLIGRSIEEGSRTLMAAVAAGRESHGKYVDSGKIDEPSDFVLSEKGKAVQKRVWEELMEILEGIEPGVTASISQH
ncbi:hypothetical protein N0V88_002359 [Collariella sp. IMI 366227]|nr:hypothetical protein N0V88_002359 [Collariella sp. IMI 366227]